MISPAELHLPLALTTGQWTVLAVTGVALLAIFWAARSEARSKSAPGAPGDSSATGDRPVPKFDAAPRSEPEMQTVDAEKERRAALERRRALERGPAPDLSGGPDLSRGPDLSNGPTLGR